MTSATIVLPRTTGRAHAWGARLVGAVAPYFLGVCMSVLALDLLGLQIVYTASVPIGVYLRRPLGTAPLSRGEYACLAGWAPTAPRLLQRAVDTGIVPSGWGTRERLTKRVVGLPGDVVTYERGAVHINGEALPESALLEQSSAGVQIPHIEYPVTLGADEVWLASSHPRGYDSRYFGPVRRSALVARAELLWRW